MKFDELHSPEYRLLLKDKDDLELSASLTKLRSNQPELLRKLYDVCSRLRFVDQLRHNVKVSFYDEFWRANNPNAKSFQYQNDRLKTYLTLTCIDVIASGKWYRFEEWLSRILRTDTSEWPVNINSAMEKLSQANSPEEAGKCLRTVINKNLKKDYYQAHGVSSSFLRFIIDDLPD